jgi:hypothetical protein
VTRQDFWQLIIRLVGQEGVAVLISTPYMDERRAVRTWASCARRAVGGGVPGELRHRLMAASWSAMVSRWRCCANWRAPSRGGSAQMFGDRLHLRAAPARPRRCSNGCRRPSRRRAALEGIRSSSRS